MGKLVTKEEAFRINSRAWHGLVDGKHLMCEHPYVLGLNELAKQENYEYDLWENILENAYVSNNYTEIRTFAEESRTQKGTWVTLKERVNFTYSDLIGAASPATHDKMRIHAKEMWEVLTAKGSFVGSAIKSKRMDLLMEYVEVAGSRSANALYQVSEETRIVTSFDSKMTLLICLLDYTNMYSKNEIDFLDSLIFAHRDKKLSKTIKTLEDGIFQRKFENAYLGNIKEDGVDWLKKRNLWGLNCLKKYTHEKLRRPRIGDVALVEKHLSEKTDKEIVDVLSKMNPMVEMMELIVSRFREKQDDALDLIKTSSLEIEYKSLIEKHMSALKNEGDSYDTYYQETAQSIKERFDLNKAIGHLDEDGLEGFLKHTAKFIPMEVLKDLGEEFAPEKRVIYESILLKEVSNLKVGKRPSRTL